MRSIVKKLAISIVLVFSVNSIANAANTVLELNTTYQGRYISNGGETGSLNTFSNGIYVQQSKDNVNNIPFSDRNFFVFNFAGLNMGNLLAAELFINNGSSYSTEGKIEFALYDVNSNIDSLRKGIGADIFSDLGNGVSYGSFITNNPKLYDNVVIEFNQAGLNAAKATSGLFAIGGSFVTQVSGLAWLFPNNDNPAAPLNYGLRLTFSDNVTAVPEADSLSMLLTGLGLTGVIARRRKK